jgi:hypothetical protein
VTSRRDEGERASHFNRIQGIPFSLPRISSLVRFTPIISAFSLPPSHSPGSVVQCLIVSRCNTPTDSSALLAPEGAEPEKPQKLFWILYVVWNEGIAERRGVGQVLGGALEMAAELKPDTKLILFG